MALVAALGGFLFGFDTIVINGAEQDIQRLWNLSGTMHGLVVSSALWGMVVGAFGGGWLSDRFGRKPTLCAIGVLYFVSALRASMGSDEQLARFAKWLPETDDSLMLGDNQAGVYAALKLKPKAAVVNLGTSGQLSRVRDEGRGMGDETVDERPFPGGKVLVCRASHVGGARLARLLQSLGYSWKRLNAEAETNPRIAACVSAIVEDLAKGVDMRGVRTIVGVGTALRLNPCLKNAIEKRFHARCLIPEVDEMAAWGAALYVLDRDNAQNEMNSRKRSVIVETLRHEIVLGKYAVNERFPSEQMLVRRFKVARATVSHAFAELKNAGILRVKVGSGAYVTPMAKGQGSIGLIVPGRQRGDALSKRCQCLRADGLSE